MTKKQLIKDFELGLCAISWNTITSKAEAVYLNGDRIGIRFDTYLSLDYVKYPSNRNYSHGADFYREWTFVDDTVRDVFLDAFKSIHKVER